MSQFDDLAATAQKMAGIPMEQRVGYQRSPEALAPREMNLTERVMTHDQRIIELEKANSEVRAALERLSQLLVDQFGLQLR